MGCKFVDNSGLYDYIFSNLLESVGRFQDMSEQYFPRIQYDMNPIFRLEPNNIGLLNEIIFNNQHLIESAVEDLVIGLFARYGKEYQQIDRTLTNEDGNLVYEYMPPIHISLKENGINTGVIFRNSATCDDLYELGLRNGLNCFDAIKVVVLVDPRGSAYEVYIQDTNYEYVEEGLPITFQTLKEFFVEQFSKQEYKLLCAYLERFNHEYDNVIRYQTIVSPTDAAIRMFKENLGKYLCTFDYDGLIGAGIYQSQKELLRRNYISRGLWKAMIGSESFADSFVSSEWYYNMYILTENLDLTGIVTGYLKSIEQLILKIVELSSHTGITAKDRNGQLVDFLSERDSIDTTLGSLESILRNNYSLFNVNAYVKNYIVDTVREWREKQRNGYFHKHNLYSIEKVDEIRNKAFLLYYLILGGCSIDDKESSLLGITQIEDVYNPFSYEDFVSWFERSLLNGCPKKTVALIFTVLPDKEDGWRLRLGAADNDDVEKRKWEMSTSFMESRHYSWGKSYDEYPQIQALVAPIREVIDALDRYLQTGALADQMKELDFIEIIGESQRHMPDSLAYKHYLPLKVKNIPSTEFGKDATLI